MTVEIAAKQRQGQSVILHQHIGHIRIGLFRRNHRHGSLIQSHGDKPVAIGGKTGHRHKQAAGCHLPGVIVYTFYFQLRSGVTFQNPNPPNQILQFHSFILLRSINLSLRYR